MADLTEAEQLEALDSSEAVEAEYLALGWPPFLAKAAMDPFRYAMGLRTGMVLCFESAERVEGCPGWVALSGIETHSISAQQVGVDGEWIPFSFDRGMHVRVTDIVWVADAPYGS